MNKHNIKPMLIETISNLANVAEESEEYHIAIVLHALVGAIKNNDEHILSHKVIECINNELMPNANIKHSILNN